MNTRQTKHYNELKPKHTHHHSALLAFIVRIRENSFFFPISYLGLIASLSPSLYTEIVSLKSVALYGSSCV